MKRVEVKVLRMGRSGGWQVGGSDVSVLDQGYVACVYVCMYVYECPQVMKCK